MPTINIRIENRIASSPEDVIICGNNDYLIQFDFDEEWDGYSVKTARFSYGGTYDDVIFEGNMVRCPIVQGVKILAVGVFAGDLKTTTPACILCEKSILCDGGEPAPPREDVYAQIMELLNSGGVQLEAGANIKIVGNKISIITTDKAEKDNTKPITSAGVYKEVGNINVLLETI